MVSWIARRRRAGDQGFALITVVLAMLVMSLLTAVMVSNIVSSFNGTSRQIQVTNALTAADAGLTDVVSLLEQGTNWTTYSTPATDPYSGGTTWGAAGTYYGWTAAGKGQYRAHFDPCSIMSASRQSSTGCNSSTDLVATVQGQYPANSGTYQTIQGLIRDTSGGPAAFNYAMFGNKGIQVHHHGDSYISPTIVTTQMYSNGFITLNYPATYRVSDMTASGSITLADGGGSIPSGNVNSSYNWPYWISGTDSTNPPRCYPALQYPPLTFPAAGSSNSYWAAPGGSGGSSNCTGDPKWSPHAVVIGDITANSVEIKSNGATKQPACEATDPLTGAANTATCSSYNGNQWTPEAYGTGCGTTGQAGFQDPITGACIKDDAGNITTGSVKFDLAGQTFTGPSGSAATSNYYRLNGDCPAGDSNCNSSSANTNHLTSCTACDAGANDTGGAIGGQVNLNDASYAPSSIPFPSLNFEDPTTGTLPTAEVDTGNARTSTATCTTLTTCHVFSSASTFLTWMESASNVYNPGGNYSASVNPCPTGWCMTWLTSAGAYTATPNQVAYIVLRGTYEITGGGNLTLSESSLRSAFGTTNTQVTPTVMVAGALVNETGGINLQASLTVVGPTMDPFNPLATDSSLPAGTVPGLLASGGNGTAIQSTDYDTDSPYTSTSNYQSLYKNAVIVRGLVYTGSWSSSAGSSTASDQHWHNADPKNSQIIVGAQVGGTLHDCNNFTFSYDPLIQNLQGFSGGTPGGIFVVDWTQL